LPRTTPPRRTSTIGGKVRRCAEKIAFTIMVVKRRAKKTLFAAAWAQCREWGRM